MKGQAGAKSFTHRHIASEHYNRRAEQQGMQNEGREILQRKISPLFIATCSLIVTMIGVGVGLNMSTQSTIRAGDEILHTQIGALQEQIVALQTQNVALQTQIEGMRTDLREVESSLRAEIQFVYEEVQRVDSRVDDIYLYLIENNPTTQ